MSLLLSGNGRPAISINNIEIESTSQTPPRLAEVNFYTDGRIANQDGLIVDNWFAVTTAGIGNSYEIRATLSSGVVDNGTFDTWLSLGTIQAWSTENGAPHGGGGEPPPQITGIIEFSIRPNGVDVILATGQVTLRA